MSENAVVGPGPGENFLQMDLVGGKVFELHCFDSPLTPAKLDIMGHELHKAGVQGAELVIAVHDKYDIAKLPGFRSFFPPAQSGGWSAIPRMEYRGVAVVEDPKRVPVTEVHFRSPALDLYGRIVELKPGLVLGAHSVPRGTLSA